MMVVTDIWIGDIDWVGGDVVNARQVMHVGQFNLDTQERNAQRLVCWSGQNLFIEAGFDAQKPLACVSLVDGSVKELDWLMYEGKSIAGEVGIDPGERVAVHVQAEGIRLIDLTSGEVFKVDWGDIAQHGLNQVRPRPIGERDVVGLGQQNNWVDRDRLVLGFTMPPGSVSRALVVLDLMQGKLDVRPMQPLLVQGHQPNFSGNFQVIAGQTPAVLVSLSFNVQGLNMMYALVDVETGAAQVPPGNNDLANVNWADRYHLIYSVTDQGLSGNGTYALDRRTGKTSRLAAFPDFSFPQSVAQGKVIVLQQGSRHSPKAIYRVNPDGSDLKQIASSGKILGTFEPEPVDVSVDGKQEKIAAVEPLPLFGSGAEGFTSDRDRLKEAIKGEPAEVQAFGLKAFDYIAENFVLGQLFKRLETALAMVEMRKRLGDQDFGIIISKVEPTSDMIDPEKAKQYYHGRTMELIKHDRKFTPEQKERIASATANRAAGELVESPSMNIKFIDRLFMEAVADAQQAVRDGADPAKSQTAANTGAPTQAPTQTQKQPPQQQQNQQEKEPAAADKVEQSVDDAAKTVDKLRGLFR